MRWREISRPASSRSQRGISTVVAPACTAPSTHSIMPVMWNIGTTPRLTASGPLWLHWPDTALCISVRWVCMQPLGSPVVPEV